MPEPPDRRRRSKKPEPSSRSKRSASRSGAGGPPETRRRARLTRRAIVEAAIRIADAEGLDAVSIRCLAAELDARPMSLYTHISDKAELLSLMGDEVVKAILVKRPLPEDWREAIGRLARRMHAAFVAHPWFVGLSVQAPRLGPNVVKLAKQNARALADLGVEPGDVWMIQGIVNDYVLGHSVRMSARRVAGEFDKMFSDGDLVEFPELAALSDLQRFRPSHEHFDLGLQTVLDGIERRFLAGRAGDTQASDATHRAG